jgi:hypothetical protein
MKGDYHRYLSGRSSESVTPAELRGAALTCLPGGGGFFDLPTHLSVAGLASTFRSLLRFTDSPTRLAVAKQAFDDAIAELDVLKSLTKTHPHQCNFSVNLPLWTSDQAEAVMMVRRCRR